MPDSLTPPGPLQIHHDTVHADWIDYNQHMNDGYYVVAFTRATDAVQDLVGLDAHYRQSTQCSIYTVEAHLQYLREVRVDTPLAFSSWILGVDDKRLHILHAMYNVSENCLLASHELMLLHVDQRSGKTTAMPPSIRGKLAQWQALHSSLELPVQSGRCIRTVVPPAD